MRFWIQVELRPDLGLERANCLPVRTDDRVHDTWFVDGAAVRDRRGHNRHLQWRHRQEALTDPEVVGVALPPRFAEGAELPGRIRHEAGRLAREVDAGRCVEPVATRPERDLLRAQPEEFLLAANDALPQQTLLLGLSFGREQLRRHLAAERRATREIPKIDVGRVGETTDEAEGAGDGVAELIRDARIDLVLDLDDSGRHDSLLAVDHFFLEGRRAGDDLEGGARGELVGDGVVDQGTARVGQDHFQILLLDRPREEIVVVSGDRHDREDVARIHVDDDSGREQRAAHRLQQDLLNSLLEGNVDREPDALPGQRVLGQELTNFATAGVDLGLAVAGDASQHRLVRRLDAGLADAVGEPVAVGLQDIELLAGDGSDIAQDVREHV